MAIDRIGRAGDLNRVTDASDAKSGESRPTARGSVGSDSFDVSVVRREVDALAGQAASLGEIRHELVDAIRRSLADGTHEVDPRRLARAILEFEDGLEP